MLAREDEKVERVMEMLVRDGDADPGQGGLELTFSTGKVLGEIPGRCWPSGVELCEDGKV